MSFTWVHMNMTAIIARMQVVSYHFLMWIEVWEYGTEFWVDLWKLYNSLLNNNNNKKAIGKTRGIIIEWEMAKTLEENVKADWHLCFYRGTLENC